MPIDITRVQAVCFDVDGTLSDTDDQFIQKLVGWLSPVRFIFRKSDVYGFARRLVMFIEGPGNWAYTLADRIGLDDRIVSLENRLYELGIGRSVQPFQLVKGVCEMLDSLRYQFPLSIISARGQRFTDKFLSQFDLQPYFIAVATRQTCIHTKPYPDPIEWAAARMGVPSSACLMVGDTVVDIIAGKNAGAQTVGVLCGFGDKKELERVGADLILENTADLLGYIQDQKRLV
jgi:phosphoglycolate phosphatase-like HAD superfamily hydrolase